VSTPPAIPHTVHWIAQAKSGDTRAIRLYSSVSTAAARREGTRRAYVWSNREYHSILNIQGTRARALAAMTRVERCLAMPGRQDTTVFGETRADVKCSHSAGRALWAARRVRSSLGEVALEIVADGRPLGVHLWERGRAVDIVADAHLRATAPSWLPPDWRPRWRAAWPCVLPRVSVRWHVACDRDNWHCAALHSLLRAPSLVEHLLFCVHWYTPQLTLRHRRLDWGLTGLHWQAES
jgi:hypothetical protein